MMNNATGMQGGPTTLSSEYVGFATVFSLMIMINLVGNTLVVLVIVNDRKKRTAMNNLLINLAFADMIVAIFMGIQFVVVPAVQHPDGGTGRFLCKFITGGATAWTGAVASIYNLVAIALECYYAFFRPYKRRGEHKAPNLRKTFFVIWLIAILWGLPLYLSVTYADGLMMCAAEWPSAILSKLYSFGWLVVGGVVPISIMSVLYFKVVRLLWFRQGPHISASQLAVLRSRKRVTTMVLGVSVIYVICWTPTLVIYFLAHVLPSEAMYSVVHKITILLATFNSSVNPVIYSLRSMRFRQNLHRLMCCTVRRRATKTVPLSLIFMQETSHRN